jgi:hypothetical protein
MCERKRQMPEYTGCKVRAKETTKKMGTGLPGDFREEDLLFICLPKLAPVGFCLLQPNNP